MADLLDDVIWDATKFSCLSILMSLKTGADGVVDVSEFITERGVVARGNFCSEVKSGVDRIGANFGGEKKDLVDRWDAREQVLDGGVANGDAEFDQQSVLRFPLC